MALRDSPYRPYVIRFLLGGMRSEVLSAMPDALRLSVRELGGEGTECRIAAEDPDLDDDALLATVARRPLGRHAAALTVSGTRVVLELPHMRFDGSSGMAFLHEVVDRACGIEPDRDGRPAARGATALALRTARLRDVGEFLRRRGQGRVSGVGAQADPAAPAVFRTFVLKRDVVAAVKRARDVSAGPGRATVSTKLCHAVLMALRSTQQTSGDLRVRVPADLRHLVPGHRVEGNFVCGDAIGTLHGTVWSPQELTRRLASASGPSGAVSLATAWPRDALARVVHRYRRPTAAINVSLVPSAPFPPLAFDGEGRTLACLSAGRRPSPVFIFVWMIDGAAHVSAYDESGLFDLHGFETQLRRELRSRYSAG